MLRVLGCITQQHDLRLVAVAAVICVLACGTTINLVARAQMEKRSALLMWLAAAAAVFGCGVWSVHFVASLAYIAGVPVAYAVPATALSALIAVTGSAMALAAWQFCPSRPIAVAVGSVLLGLAISGMHYCGVSAMQVPGRLYFDPQEVVASILLSIGFAIVALARSGTLTSPWRRLEVAVWLVLAIVSLHFTGMSGLSIRLGLAVSTGYGVLGSGVLAIAVASVSVAILIVGLSATLMEQHLSHRTVLELLRMKRMSDISQEVLIIHRDGVILQVNTAGGRMFGVPPAQMVGRKLLDLVPEADHAVLLRSIRSGDTAPTHEEMQVQTSTGSAIPVEFSCAKIEFESKPADALVLRDLSDRKRDEARIRHLAHHDALTDLPNRFLLQERMAQIMEASRRSDEIFALFCLDLDRFKPVNDLLGHAAGDMLLKQVAERLSAEFRSTDTVARVGGDEFVIIADEIEPESLPRLAERVIEAIAEPFNLDGQSVEIGTSIGIALFPRDGDTQQALMHAADTALYRAKRDGRGAYRFFEPLMDQHLQARRRLELDLRHALDRGELEVYYQPVASSTTGVVQGFEALVRWHHPEHGLVSPGEFVPLAEETGLITKIGQWVLETACRTAMAWQEPCWVAVNVSPVQFRQTDLPDLVSDILARTGLPPARLEIELTEGVLIEDAQRASEVLSALRKLGVHIALDDFGTGYSSLSYLHALKFDKLKIDRSFIAQLGENEGSGVIVRTIIGLAHSLGLQVVAEGVEHHHQLTVVRDLMCDQVQGYLLGRPMPMDGPTELVLARARNLLSGGGKVIAKPETPDGQGQPDSDNAEHGEAPPQSSRETARSSMPLVGAEIGR